MFNPFERVNAADAKAAHARGYEVGYKIGRTIRKNLNLIIATTIVCVVVRRNRH